MEKAREDKDHKAREPAAEAPAHERGVDMAAHEMIDGFVPRPPVIPHAGAVPPLRVELPIAESHDFRERIQYALEDREKAR